MAGLEVIVRPVVLPNIRPAPAPALAPDDTPDKGIATLSGGSGSIVDLPYTYSMSFSRQKNHQQEQERQVVPARVYQKEEDGTVNKNNWLDSEVIQGWITADPTGARNYIKFAPTKEADNVEILGPEVKKQNPDYTGPTDGGDSRVPTGGGTTSLLLSLTRGHK